MAKCNNLKNWALKGKQISCLPINASYFPAASGALLCRPAETINLTMATSAVVTAALAQ